MGSSLLFFLHFLLLRHEVSPEPLFSFKFIVSFRLKIMAVLTRYYHGSCGANTEDAVLYTMNGDVNTVHFKPPRPPRKIKHV